MTREAADKWLDRVGKWGISTVLLVVLIWQVVIPLKDEAVDSLHRQSAASEKVAGAVSQMAQSFEEQKEMQRLMVERLDRIDQRLGIGD